MCSAYELWFKQILFELDSIRELFTTPVRTSLLILTVRPTDFELNMQWIARNDIAYVKVWCLSFVCL